MIHPVTGGSGSGKSAYAEQCILDFGGTRRVYIATMQPFGAEGQARIARHRKMRAAKQFSTMLYEFKRSGAGTGKRCAARMYVESHGK